MNIEDITNYDIQTVEEIKKLEKIPRQITTSVSFGVAFGETQRKKIEAGIESGEVLNDESIINVAKNNIQRTEEDVTKEWEKLRKQYNLKAANCIIGDLCCGILTALTDPLNKSKFASVAMDDIKDRTIDVYKDDHGQTKSLLKITITRQGIYKLAMGATVDENGRILRKLEPAVRGVKEHIDEILCGKVPEPMIICSSKKDQNSGLWTVKRGKPILIKNSLGHLGKTYPDVFDLLLDPYYFPMTIGENGNFKISGNYFQTVAGLSSVLSVGRYNLAHKYNLQFLPTIAPMHRVNLFLQLGMSYNNIQPLTRKILEYKNGRWNMRLDAQQTVKELYPAAMQKKNDEIYISYRDFIHFISTSTNCLLAGVRTLGISDQISKTKAIFPAIEKSAEFDNNIIKLKAEDFANIAPFDYNIAALNYINNRNARISNNWKKSTGKNKKDFQREIPQTFV